MRSAVDGREVGRVVYADKSEPGYEIDHVSLSPDGHYLWMTVHRHSGRHGGGAAREPDEIEKTARIWDAFSGEEVARIKFEHAPGIAVFSPDAKRLVTDDGTALQVWDVAGKREIASVKHQRAVVPPIFSADGTYLALSEEKALRLWETDRWREVRSMPLASRVVTFSPNGRYLAAGTDESLRIWEVTDGREGRALPVKYATAIVYSRDGRYVATSNWNFYEPSDRGIHIWETKDGHEVGRLQFHEKEASQG